MVSAGLSEEFLQVEIAAVLQAASTGQLPNANSRIHILVIGQPGAGKKIIVLYLRTLEPTCLSAQASTLTRAGLAAGAKRVRGSLVAAGGLLVQAHLGAASIEDLQGMRPAHRDQNLSVLAQVMEDGTVDLSNQASQHFVASTAVYIDLNRRSQLKADASLAVGGPRAVVADLGLRVDLLTRIDVINELPPSMQSTLDGSVAMMGLNSEPDFDTKTARQLQVVMAVLRDRYPEVDLTPTTSLAEKRLQKLLLPLRHCRTADFDPSTFFRRLSNSTKKIIAASARLHDRSYSTEEDLALAMELLGPKLEFIRRLATAEPDPKDKAGRLAQICQLFSGQEVRPHEVMDALGIPERTVMRYLDEIGVKTATYGTYQIPPAVPEPQEVNSATGRVAATKSATGRVSAEGEDASDEPLIPEGPEKERRRHRIEALTPEGIRSFTVEQIQSLTAEEVGWMTRDQVEALRPKQVAAFTPAQLCSFQNNPFYRCLTNSQARAMTLAQARAMLESIGMVDRWGQERQTSPAVRQQLETIVARDQRSRRT